MNTTDESLVDLITAVAEQYRKQISDTSGSKNEIRIEIIRKLELVSQSIKGLMKYRQQRI